jgi:hypothetical protein
VFPILQKTAYSGQVDRLRYASEVFYCKYAPAQVPAEISENTLDSLAQTEIMGMTGRKRELEYHMQCEWHIRAMPVRRLEYAVALAIPEIHSVEYN